MTNETIFTFNFVENPLLLEIVKASVHEWMCARAWLAEFYAQALQIYVTVPFPFINV
jgi:hypothetical protein